MKRNHLMKKAAATVMALLLIPAAALAVTENKVEEAPIDEFTDEVLFGIDPPNLDYRPDEGLYAGWSDWEPAWGSREEYTAPVFTEDGFPDEIMQAPRLTAGETVRAKKLLEAYNSGERTYDGISVLNKMTDATVGVYPLDPADYDGETVYCILPWYCLSDTDLLSLIDAFHTLGLEFDPAALNYRNCNRGGITDSSRFLTEEESDRRDEIARMIARGAVTPDQIGPDTFVVPIAKGPENVWSYGSFRLIPYRPLTDDELAALLFAEGAEAEKAFDYSEMENKARAFLLGNLRLPITTHLDFLYASDTELATWDGVSIGEGRMIRPCVTGRFSFRQDGRPGMLQINMTEDGSGYTAIMLEYTDLNTDREDKDLSEEGRIASARAWLKDNWKTDIGEKLTFVPEKQDGEVYFTVSMNAVLDGTLYHFEQDRKTGDMITFCVLVLEEDLDTTTND